MSNKAQLTIGTDPEFVLLEGNTPVSAIEVLKRGKDDKIALEEGVNVYYDNILVEGNVPPANTPEQFVENLRVLFSNFSKRFPGFSLGAKASHTFRAEDCQHPKAQEFGCDPELDVYAEATVPPPQADQAKTFRSAGGHIHIGASGSDFLQQMDNQVITIKMMDLFVGVASVILDNDPSSLDRKRLYGKAGRFRFTPYGVEYRTPSNNWTSRPELAKVIAEITFEVASMVERGEAEGILAGFDREAVIHCINNHSKELAESIWQRVPINEAIKSKVMELSKLEHSVNISEAWL